MHFDLPRPVLRALSMLEEGGFSAFVVGGCVRDFVLGIPPHDYDICTAASPDEMKEIFRGERTIETGLKHGTLTVLMEGEPLEITTFRLDGDYLDGRHPSSVIFTRKIEEDLSRRDFTVNAMAYSPREGICDPFGGREDCKKGIIRCVGEPERRFNEDALRILRALRFSARLRFPIADETATAIHALKENLSRISRERIAVELNGLLMGQSEKVMDAFWDVLLAVLPQLSGADERTKKKSIAMLCAAPRELPLLWAAFLGCCHGESEKCAGLAREALLSLKMPVKLMEDVSRLLTWREAVPEIENLQELLMHMGPDGLSGLLRLYHGEKPGLQERLQQLLDENACYSLRQLQVNGKDMAALGLKGPRIGEMLNGLLLQVVRGELENEKAALLKRAAELEG